MSTFKVELPEDEKDLVLINQREQLRKRNEYVKGCQNSIRLAVELNRRNVNKDIMNIHGMSAAKNRIMLNHLVSYPKARYLEVGVYAGATFCAALAGNKPEYACAIDNFTEFTEYANPEKEFLSNTKKFVNTKFDFFKRDCFDLTKTQKEKLKQQRINMFYYDGPHTEEDHMKAITEYYDFLDEVFIIIVDDWNELPVRNGTFRGLKAMDLKVWWQIDLKADTSTGSKDKREWWNGVWVAVCQKRTGKIEVK